MNGSPEYVRERCNKSLERLGVDYIDLYYIQRSALFFLSSVSFNLTDYPVRSVDSTVPIEVSQRDFLS